MRIFKLFTLSFLTIVATTGMAQAVQNNVNPPPPCQAERDAVQAAQVTFDQANQTWVLANNEVNNRYGLWMSLVSALAVKNALLTDLKARIDRGEQGLLTQYFELKRQVEKLENDIPSAEISLNHARTSLANATAAMGQARGDLQHAKFLLENCLALVPPGNGNQTQN